MLVPFLIMLREGIEAALIVGIVASYLKQTGRDAWMPAVWVGILLAIALSLFVGAGLQMVSAQFPQKAQEFFEAIVGLIAVIVLSSMVFWMRKAARSIKSELHTSINSAFSHSTGQAPALIAMVFFAVAREGLESVFFLLAIFQQSTNSDAPLGAVLGILVSIVLGYGIYAGGIRINLRRFFFWTGLFILFVAAGILAGTLRHFHEAGVWNSLQTVVIDLSGILPVSSPVRYTVVRNVRLSGYADTGRSDRLCRIPFHQHLHVSASSYGRRAAAAQASRSHQLIERTFMSQSAGSASPRPSSQRLMKLAVVGAALLVVAGGVAFYYASKGVKSGSSGDAIIVTIKDGACDPNAITVPAGRSTFTIVNKSDRALEWEILDGVMVLEERENIVPGFSQTLQAKLKAGDYEITCGLLNSPRGTLHVTPSAESDAEAARPALVAYLGRWPSFRCFLSRRRMHW